MNRVKAWEGVVFDILAAESYHTERKKALGRIESRKMLHELGCVKCDQDVIGEAPPLNAGEMPIQTVRLSGLFTKPDWPVADGWEGAAVVTSTDHARAGLRPFRTSALARTASAALADANSVSRQLSAHPERANPSLHNRGRSGFQIGEYSMH